MSIANTLNTNEVKNAAGTEVEFQSLGGEQNRTREFAAISEAPALKHRITVKHSETGIGIRRRRKSAIRVDKTVVSTVDSVTPVVVSALIWLDSPVGALLASTEMANVLAELGSFTFLDGTGNTFLYAGSGVGSQALITGGI